MNQEYKQYLAEQISQEMLDELELEEKELIQFKEQHNVW